jgi:hypothetical protein
VQVQQPTVQVQQPVQVQQQVQQQPAQAMQQVVSQAPIQQQTATVQLPSKFIPLVCIVLHLFCIVNSSKLPLFSFLLSPCCWFVQ